MSSILTNNSAMVALQTLKSVNRSLMDTQSQISTGKQVASAKDNSAVWAISKAMDSDVKGFQAISESLALGEATVAVARNAAETVTDLLTDMKGRIVAAQEANVDRASIQADINELTEQIGSVVNAAQFNGLNLVNGSSSDPMEILSSLNRDASGTVTDEQIEVARRDLSVTGGVSATFGATPFADQADANALIEAGGFDTNFNLAESIADGATTTIADEGSLTFTIGEVNEGASYRVVLDNVTVNVVGGGTTTGQRTFEYVAQATDGTADVARALTNQISAFFGAATDTESAYSVAQGTGTATNTFTVTNGAAGGATNEGMDVFVQASLGGEPGSAPGAGGLGAVSTIDVTTDSGASSALTAIDGLIQQAIDAAAAFGSAQSRIETQSGFVSKLMDSLKSGIGTLVDANMEEASARLQALQVQQQLGIQALSIANQAPQNILALFR
jgi:flagellin